MTRTISAQITDITGQPRAGLLVTFHAIDGLLDVNAMTDDSGVFMADLEALVPYRVSVENAVIVAGQHFPAGTVFEVTVPEGEGVAGIADVLITFLDASRPALLDMIAVLQETQTALEARIIALEIPE